MKRVIYTNKRGESVVLGETAPYILTKIEGTGAAQANLQTQKAPYQDGVTHLDTTLEPRTLILEIMVLAENAEEMQQRRRRLAQVLNPKLGPGTLRYGYGGKEWEIEAVPELAPAFPDGGDFEDTMQPGLISLLCPNPFWLDPHESQALLASVLPGFTFPLEIAPDGIEVSTINQGTVTLHNPGDAEVPLLFEFRGPAENPCITNEDTGEFIRVVTPLHADERMIISTEFGSKRVEIHRDDGTIENAFYRIDYDSTFWQLPVGKTRVHFSADVGSDDAEIHIRYRYRYAGI